MPEPALAYERAGSGEPLLLLHGLGGTRLIWKPQFERLARDRDVVALDMPGFGDSEPLPDGSASAVAMAEAIVEFCASIGIERPHVAGNSLGGWVALEMAKAGNAASTCLLSPAGLWRRPLGPRRVDVRRVAKALGPVVPLLARSRAARERMLGSVVGRPENVPAEDGRELIAGWINSSGYEAANDAMRAGVFEAPDRVEVPTTIAWCDLDRLVAPPKPERRPPGSRFLVLEGCGHTPNWDAPERIASLILEASSGSAAGRAGSEAAA